MVCSGWRAPRILALLASCLILSTPILRAQDPEITLTAVRESFEGFLKRSKTPPPHDLALSIEELQALVDAPLDTRERACELIARIWKATPGTDLGRVWRFSAVETVALLAEESLWLDRLFTWCGTRGSGSLSDYGFLTERSLARLRAQKHVLGLVKRVLTGDEGEVLLALGALSQMDRPNLSVSLEPARENFLKLAKSPSAAVRARAVACLGLLQHELLPGPLLAAAEDDAVAVRVAAAKALSRHLRALGSDVVLGRLLRDSSFLVREASATGFRLSEDPAVVPLLIRRLESEPLRQRRTITDALFVLTGHAFPSESEPWKEWLKKGRPAPTPADEDRYGREEDRDVVPTYHGIPVLSDRVVFVLDVSGSMGFSIGKTSKDKKRIDYAKDALLSVLSTVDERTRFGIVFFNHDQGPLSRQLVPRTEKNRAAAERFVRAQEPLGGTDTEGALLTAFALYPDADTVYLLSDGVPSQGRTDDPYEILAAIHRRTEESGVRINTVALLNGELLDPFKRNREDKPAAARFMRDVARITDGQFVDRR